MQTPFVLTSMLDPIPSSVLMRCVERVEAALEPDMRRYLLSVMAELEGGVKTVTASAIQDSAADYECRSRIFADKAEEWGSESPLYAEAIDHQRRDHAKAQIVMTLMVEVMHEGGKPEITMERVREITEMLVSGVSRDLTMYRVWEQARRHILNMELSLPPST